MPLRSYGSVYNIGHQAIETIFDGEIVVEEKIDGSLFAFGVIDGELALRSKGAVIYIGKDSTACSEAMFQKAADTAIALHAKRELVPGWTYYGEYLQKPKHNTLCYDRVPKGNIIIFDIDRNDQHFLSPHRKAEEALRLGLEWVPILFKGKIDNWHELRLFLDRESILGGTKIEGMVIKSYYQYTQDKKFLKGKHVSKKFIEAHQKNWKSDGNKKDIIQEIIAGIRTDARWEKAVMHLRERGGLDGSPKDIFALLKEVQIDIEKELTRDIRDALYNHFRKPILKGSVRGLAEWYKNKLAEGAFSEDR